MKLKTLKIVNDKTQFLAVSFIEDKPLSNLRIYGFVKVIPNSNKEEYIDDVKFTKTKYHDYIKTLFSELFKQKKSLQTITLTNQIKFNKPSLLKFDVTIKLEQELSLEDCLSKLDYLKEHAFNNEVFQPYFTAINQ